MQPGAAAAPLLGPEPLPALEKGPLGVIGIRTALRYSAAVSPECTEKYFDGEEAQGLPVLAAAMAGFGIGSRTKKTSTMVSGLLRACVARGVNVSREERGI